MDSNLDSMEIAILCKGLIQAVEIEENHRDEDLIDRAMLIAETFFNDQAKRRYQYVNSE